MLRYVMMLYSTSTNLDETVC